MRHKAALPRTRKINRARSLRTKAERNGLHSHANFLGAVTTKQTLQPCEPMPRPYAPQSRPTPNSSNKPSQVPKNQGGKQRTSQPCQPLLGSSGSSTLVDGDLHSARCSLTGQQSESIPPFVQRPEMGQHRCDIDPAVAYQIEVVAQFASAKSPDLQFSSKFKQVNDRWESIIGWPLYTKLHEGDHYLTNIYMPIREGESQE